MTDTTPMVVESEIKVESDLFNVDEVIATHGTPKHMSNFSFIIKEEEVKEEPSEDVPGSSEQLEFERDIAKLFAVCNIPLSKSQDPFFKSFIETHTGHIVPSHEKLVASIKNDSVGTLDEVRAATINKDIAIRMSEAKDFHGKSYSTVLISPIDGSFNDLPFLANVSELKRLNGSTLEGFLSNTLKEVYGPGFDYHRIKIYITDGGAHSLQASKALKAHNPSIIHLICMAHSLQRVADQARFEFKDVHTLICESRRLFSLPDIKKGLLEDSRGFSMPSSNLSWLELAFFHYVNFEILKDFMISQEDNEGASESLRKVKEIYEGDSIHNDLMLMYVSLNGVHEAINTLEQRPPLQESVKLIDDLLENVQLEPFKSLLNASLKKNTGLKRIQSIAANLSKGSKEWMKYKFAPIINCDNRQ
ncbi:Uncharacterized protein FKW44_017077, partial [Caligus rogercresseyi]